MRKQRSGAHDERLGSSVRQAPRALKVDDTDLRALTKCLRPAHQVFELDEEWSYESLFAEAAMYATRDEQTSAARDFDTDYSVMSSTPQPPMYQFLVGGQTSGGGGGRTSAVNAGRSDSKSSGLGDTTSRMRAPARRGKAKQSWDGVLASGSLSSK